MRQHQKGNHMYVCGKSDVGIRRQINEDSYRALSIWDGEAALLVVCDGMGGHQAGEIASRTAVELFCEKVCASPCKEEAPQRILEAVRYTLVCAASEANAVVRELAETHPDYHGMGTTLVAVLVYRGYFYAINIGDSRFYIVTRHEARQVTKDHSFVQYLLDNGKLTPEEARSYPRKNVITRAIGVSEKLEIDFFSASLAPWEKGYLLLCSDGLSNYADEKELINLLYGSIPNPKVSTEAALAKKVNALIAFANEKGGSDNITAVLAKF